MDAIRKLTLLVGAAMTALLLVAGPAVAAEDLVLAVEDAPAEETPAEGGEEGGRIQVAETPRDRVGLLLLGALVLAGGAGLANARRQLKGERPQASGEFRWR